jgi:6-phosphogluconolactonase
MTAQVFNRAAVVIFLVSGDVMAAPLKAVLEGGYEPGQLPAQLIRPTQGTLLLIVDKPAASLLRSSNS